MRSLLGVRVMSAGARLRFLQDYWCLRQHGGSWGGKWSRSGCVSYLQTFSLQRFPGSAQSPMAALLQGGRGTGRCGQGGGSPRAPRSGCAPISRSWPAGCPVGCCSSTRTPTGVCGGGGSQQAKCVSVHSGFKRSSHMSRAPRLQLTLPLLGWVFRRILISSWWLRESFGKPVCPFPLGCSISRSGWN